MARPLNPALSYRRDIRSAYLLLGAAKASDAPIRNVARSVAFIAGRERWQFSPRRLSRRVDAIPIVRPTFMLGTQGGGLTLVGRALQRHRDVVTVGGGHSAWTSPDEIGHQPSRMRRLPRALWGCKFREDITHPVFGSLHSNVYATSELFPLYRRTAADVTEEDRRAFERIIREHIAVYAPNVSSARFLDKTQTYTLAVPYLDALLAGHEPCFVFVARDPYAMAYRSVEGQPPGYVAWPSYRERLQLMAEHWATSYRVALDDLERVERSLLVRFEDFCREPEKHLRAIAALIGIEFNGDMLPKPEHRFPFATLSGDNKWYPIRSDPWRGRVPPEDVAVIDEICGDLAEKLGYR